MLQGALLVAHGNEAVADAFCATRFGEGRGQAYGSFEVDINTDAIVRRAIPTPA